MGVPSVAAIVGGTGADGGNVSGDGGSRGAWLDVIADGEHVGEGGNVGGGGAGAGGGGWGVKELARLVVAHRKYSSSVSGLTCRANDNPDNDDDGEEEEGDKDHDEDDKGMGDDEADKGVNLVEDQPSSPPTPSPPK